MGSKKEYTATEISKLLDVYYQTANKRMKSRYAKERWGVKIKKLPDGSIRRVVPKENLHLWKKAINYRGRPVFAENK